MQAAAVPVGHGAMTLPVVVLAAALPVVIAHHLLLHHMLAILAVIDMSNVGLYRIGLRQVDRRGLSLKRRSGEHRKCQGTKGKTFHERYFVVDVRELALVR